MTAPHRVPRRVRRGWVAAGVLLVVLAALGSASLFRALGPSQEYLAVAADVPAGARLSASDLTVVRLNRTPGLAAVAVADAGEVVDGYAAVPLAAGTLLSPAQVVAERVPAPGEQLVALPVTRDDLPGGGLVAGDPVLLVAAGGHRTGEDRPRTFPARVHRVHDGTGRGSGVVVDLLVAAEHGPAVARLAASGHVAVVRVAEADR